MELFIPAKLRTNDVLGKGFEKADLKRLILVTLLGALGGLAVSLCITKDMQTLLLAVVSTGFVFGGSAYFALLKLAINLSIYDYFKLFLRFLRGQRYYPYKRMKEWS